MRVKSLSGAMRRDAAVIGVVRRKELSLPVSRSNEELVPIKQSHRNMTSRRSYCSDCLLCHSAASNNKIHAWVACCARSFKLAIGGFYTMAVPHPSSLKRHDLDLWHDVRRRRQGPTTRRHCFAKSAQNLCITESHT
ncbi:hypothetical protein KCU61_g579, partial [Aureobasidium melanogenum]